MYRSATFESAVNYPLPLIKDIFEAFKGCKVFSRIDLKGGFHQFKVNEKHQEFTTFTWKGKQYKFQGAPFGFKHLPAVFQKVLATLFQDCEFVLVYIDDIIVFSHSFVNHAKHLHKVFALLNQANLKVNMEKCLFALTKILILGYQISEEGIEVCPQKLLQIEEWKTPTTGKHIQKHLGFFNYFREMIPLYAKIVAPLDELRYTQKIIWNHQYEQIYTKLKRILSSGLVLSYPDFERDFEVATDASNYGIGAVLYQVIDGTTHYIAFASRALQGGEKNYGATKRELLAVVNALKHFRYYLFGKKFRLYTDHKALTCLHTQKTTNQMINGWLETLLELDFEVIHRPGVLNVLPDALSRVYDADDPNNLANPVFKKLKASDLEKLDQTNQLSATEIAKLVELIHLEGHFGTKKMIDTLLDRGYFWLNMKNDVEKVAQECVECHKYNISKSGYHPLSNISALLPLDHIAIDLKEYPLSADGKTYCLVVIDICSRFVWLRALQDKKAQTVARSLLDILFNFGLPKIIQSDNGTEFVNKVIEEFTRLANIDHRLITAYHPQANGAAERTVQTSSQIVYKQLKGRDQDWPLYLGSTQLFINMSVTRLHGSTPYSLMFARNPNHFKKFVVDDSRPHVEEEELLARLDYMAAIVYPSIKAKVKEQHAKYKQYFTKRHKLKEFPAGSLVMVKNDTRSKKTEERFHGPYVVQRRTAGGSYHLVDHLGVRFTRSPSQLKLVAHGLHNPQADTVLEILEDRKTSQGTYEYLVKWNSQREGSWVAAKDFDDYTPIRKYFSKKAQIKDVGTVDEALELVATPHFQQPALENLQQPPKTGRARPKMKRGCKK
jgi:transposase InsO family protein